MNVEFNKMLFVDANQGDVDLDLPNDQLDDIPSSPIHVADQIPSFKSEHASFSSQFKLVSTLKLWPALNNRLTFEQRLSIRSFVIKVDHPSSSFEKLSFFKRKKQPHLFNYGENVFIIVDNGNNSGTSVLCFGNNRWAQLGLGESMDNWKEMQDLVVHPFLSSLSIQDITYGKDFFVLLTTDGFVYTWGRNHLKQLGLGEDAKLIVSNPTLVVFNWPGPHKVLIKSIRCGRRHCVALSRDPSEIWMWGSFKQAGNNACVSLPTKVFFPADFQFIRKIDAGGTFCAALDAKGNISCWGGSIKKPNTWQAVPNILRFTEKERDAETNKEKETEATIIDFACGDKHIVALTDTFKIFYYGGYTKSQIDKPAPESLSTFQFDCVAIDAWQGLTVMVRKGDPDEQGAHFCAILGQTRSRPIAGLPQTCCLNEPVKSGFLTPFEQPVLAMAFYLNSGTRCLVEYDRQLFLKRISCPMQRRLVSIFNNPSTGTDVEFVFPAGETRSIFAHRFLLQICSAYMGTLFSQTWDSKHSKQVEITTVGYETFYLYLYYLYTGQLEMNWRQAGSLLELAHCYQEQDLVKDCIEFLLESMDDTNCLYVYDFVVLCSPHKADLVLAHIRRHYGAKVANETKNAKPQTGVADVPASSAKNGKAKKKIARECVTVPAPCSASSSPTASNNPPGASGVIMARPGTLGNIVTRRTARLAVQLPNTK